MLRFIMNLSGDTPDLDGQTSTNQITLAKMMKQSTTWRIDAKRFHTTCEPCELQYRIGKICLIRLPRSVMHLTHKMPMLTTWYK